MDISVLLAILAVTLLSTATLTSAADGNLFPWAIKHMIRFIFGLVMLLLVTMADIRIWYSLAYPIYLCVLLLLITVEVKGHIGMGAQRWVDLYFFNLQPSELMKIAVVLALARYFHSMTYEDVGKIKQLIIPLLILTAPILLVLKQPDLGTAMIILATAASVLYFTGVRVWFFIGSLVLAGASLPFLWTCLHDYQKQRVLTFLNPGDEVAKSGYQILQSKIAIGSAGFFGKGYMQGTQSRLSFLPEKQTDCVFSMFTEEWGLLGGIFLILLYAYMIFYGLMIALQARSHFCRLLCAGLTTTLFLHVFINIGMVCELLPVVGVPLPLMSYGGTSLLTVMICYGLIQSSTVHKETRIGASLS